MAKIKRTGEEVGPRYLLLAVLTLVLCNTIWRRKRRPAPLPGPAPLPR